MGASDRDLFNDVRTNKPLRILQVVNTLARSDGGPARNAFELHKAFNAIPGVSSVMVTISSSDAADTVYHGEQSLVRGGSLGSTVGVVRLMRLLRTADAVVIHGYYLPWAPFVAALARIWSTRVLLTPHGSLTNYQQSFSRLKKRTYDKTIGAWLRSSVSCFVVGSERERDELASKFPRVVVDVAGVGATFPPVVPAAPKNSAVRLLSISRVAPKKRIDLAIRTVAELAARGYLVELVVAGSGPPSLLAKLQGLVKQSGLDDRVRFLGEIDDDGKLPLYELADVFIAPSDDENFGISVAEALSHGVPCVVSEYVASASRIMPPAGIRVSNRTPTSLADAVVELVDNGEEGRDAARQFAWASFSWRAVADRWLKVAWSDSV